MVIKSLINLILNASKSKEMIIRRPQFNQAALPILFQALNELIQWTFLGLSFDVIYPSMSRLIGWSANLPKPCMPCRDVPNPVFHRKTDISGYQISPDTR